MTRPSEIPALRGPLHHIGYNVENIPSAVAEWGKWGVGPFVVFEHMQFDELTYMGAPCVFDHSTALASFGEVFVELQEVHEAGPPAFAAQLGGVPACANAVNHIAYFSADPVEDSARFEAAGFPLTCRIRLGNHEDRMHYVPCLGHGIELHSDSPALREMFAWIRAEAETWDGTAPIRTIPLPAI